MTKPAIRRLARRGGVTRISGLIYEERRSGRVESKEHDEQRGVGHRVCDDAEPAAKKQRSSAQHQPRARRHICFLEKERPKEIIDKNRHGSVAIQNERGEKERFVDQSVDVLLTFCAMTSTLSYFELHRCGVASKTWRAMVMTSLRLLSKLDLNTPVCGARAMPTDFKTTTRGVVQAL